MKEELFVYVNNERKQLDLPNPSDISLKWVSNLFNDISKLTCSYSYTFKIPMTTNNRRVLDYADDIRHTSELTHKVLEAEFYINGVCLCPNANLYISEMDTAFKCVMTWRVLKGFETLKSSGDKLVDLNSLGKIQWGASEEYGGTADNHSNMDAVLYPDYDAGVPHEAGTPPKPCVPVYRLIQMINEIYGVKFNIGTLISSGMGLKPRGYFNNPNYYGRRVYDDYISNGVLPLVNSQISNERFRIRGILGIGSHTMKLAYLEYTQKWSVLRCGTGSTKNPLYVLHYAIIEGEYTSVSKKNEAGIEGAAYIEPQTLYVGMPIIEDFRGNDFVKPIYVFQHDTGLSFYNANKSQRAQIEYLLANNYPYASWRTRTYKGIEQVIDTIGRAKDSAYRTWAECIEDTSGVYSYSSAGGDAGAHIGVIGFYTNCAFTLKGSCTLHISKSAVDAGRVSVNDYMWMCLAKKSLDKDELETVTDKDISSDVGFQSVDKPTYDEVTGTYICHFDFGQEYEARKISVDADDDETLIGYVFIPYFPEDYLKTKYKINDEGEQEEDGEECSLIDGDMYFTNFIISELNPTVEAAVLPLSMNITQSLPEISCFDFIKSVFYMNGAMPRVERDGETISAMYYKQLRDRVNDGQAIDWSDKLISKVSELPSSVKYRNTNFSKANYLEMSYSVREKTEDELLEELDKYSEGYGIIDVDDKILDEEKAIFKSSFYPAYIKNIRFPLIKVGRTCKVWEGDKTLVGNVPPIYGVMVMRMLDPSYEDTAVTRPGLADITKYHIRMNIFSPFDDESLMRDMFGYLESILNNYVLVKEKFLLNEMDLRDFDESVPVYLSKYNAFFAVSTIQRDKTGVSTVELVKLPRVTEDINAIDLSYEVELLSAGSVTFDTGANDTSSVYIQRTARGTWETSSGRQFEFGSEGVYAVTADNASSDDSVLRVLASSEGRYRYTYTDPDTGERKSIVRSEANIFFDGQAWNGSSAKSIYENDQTWHYVEIEIPIRDHLGAIIERRRWASPLFVSGKAVVDYDPDQVRYVVSGYSWLISFTLGLIRNYTSNPDPICYENSGHGTSSSTTYNTLSLPVSDYVSRYLCPYEANKLKDDSYTLKYTIPSSLTYTVAEMLGVNTISSKRLSVKLRVYYDDERVLGGTTLTFTKSEFGQYHVFKFIADIVNEAGEVVEEFRKKVYWFVSTVNQSVITEDFGDEHDDDETVKVNKVTVSGSSYLSDFNTHDYVLAFTPEYADVGVSSVQVTANVGSSVVTISNVSKSGFTLQAASLPDEEQAVVLTVKTILEDGSSFNTTHQIAIVKPYIVFLGADYYAAKTSFDAINGTGSASYRMQIRPGNNGSYTIRSVTSSNSAIAVSVTDKVFELSASGITQDETTVITAVVDYGGMVLTGTMTVKAVLKDAWSVEILDNAGVLIIDVNGKFYTESEWLAAGILNDDADGIAVSDGTHRFIISKKEVGSIAVGGSGTLVSGQFTATDEATAYTDFNGKANTDAMIAALSSSAAHSIRNSNPFPSGIEGYLGTAGEWAVVQSKRSAVLRLLNVIGAAELTVMTTGRSTYWSSTQRSASDGWQYNFGTDNKAHSMSKTIGAVVRAFGAVRMDVTPVTRGSIAIVGSASFETTNGSGMANYEIVITPSGATVSGLTVTSDNEAVVVSNVSKTGFRLSVSGILYDKVATITVKARVNGLIETTTKQVTAIGNTVVDFAKLDAAHALIIDKNYNLYTEEEWYASNLGIHDAEGIAVSDGTHRFIVSPEEASNGTRYYWGGRNTVIDGLGQGTSDYDGEGNTEKIIAAVTGSDGYFTESPYSAAAVAKSYVFPSGEKGYLGSAGEWGVLDRYFEDIETLLSAIGGSSIIKNSSWTFWTSSNGYGDGAAYVYHAYVSSQDGSHNHSLQSTWRGYSKSYIRPFRKF